jgi:hypothetical protein
MFSLLLNVHVPQIHRVPLLSNQVDMNADLLLGGEDALSLQVAEFVEFKIV